MKFNKTYNEYMKEFVAEGLLGSVAAAVPRTIGTALKNVVKNAYADNPFVQAASQVRQQQATERSEVRSKNKEILEKVKTDLKNDPNFTNTKITFTDSTYVPHLSTGRKIDRTTLSYGEIETASTIDRYRRTARSIDIDQIEGIKKLISETDLNKYNLFDSNVQNKLKEKIKLISAETEKNLKTNEGEDYKKRLADVDKVFEGIKQDIQIYFKPLGVGKTNSEKQDWLYILIYFGGKNGLEIKR